MKNSKKHLEAVVIGIKRLGDKKGKIISEREIANQANISEKQLFAYLNGIEEIPDKLITDLIHLYGFKHVVLETKTIVPVRFEESQDKEF